MTKQTAQSETADATFTQPLHISHWCIADNTARSALLWREFICLSQITAVDAIAGNATLVASHVQAG